MICQKTSVFFRGCELTKASYFVSLMTCPCTSKELNLTLQQWPHEEKPACWDLWCVPQWEGIGFVHLCLLRICHCCWVRSETLLPSQPGAPCPAPAWAVVQHIHGGLGHVWVGIQESCPSEMCCFQKPTHQREYLLYLCKGSFLSLWETWLCLWSRIR